MFFPWNRTKSWTTGGTGTRKSCVSDGVRERGNIFTLFQLGSRKASYSLSYLLLLSISMSYKS
jgi:hypothetical protein